MSERLSDQELDRLRLCYDALEKDFYVCLEMKQQAEGMLAKAVLDRKQAQAADNYREWGICQHALAQSDTERDKLSKALDDTLVDLKRTWEERDAAEAGRDALKRAVQRMHSRVVGARLRLRRAEAERDRLAARVVGLDRRVHELELDLQVRAAGCAIVGEQRDRARDTAVRLEQELAECRAALRGVMPDGC